MQKKIIFVEPYATWGGHMWANVNYFQDCIHDAGVPYTFIIEEDLEVVNRGCLERSLTYSAKLFQKPEILRMRTRASEYRKILNNDPQRLYVFLTNYDLDFAVWRQLLKDEHLRKQIVEKELLIIIQTSVLSFAFLGLLEECRNELQELSKNVFFGFFSELQPLIVQRYLKINNCVTLFRVSHKEGVYGSQAHDAAATYLSFLGGFSGAKNPDLVFEAHRVFNDQPFQVQLFPLDGINAMMFSAWARTRRAHDRIFCMQLSAANYSRVIFNTKIGLLPYNAYQYAAQASGLLEDYMFAGIPTIVPQNTWLSYFQELFNGGGLAFDPDKKGDFQQKIKCVIEHYAEHKEKAIHAVSFINEDRRVTKYLDIIYNLDRTRRCDAETNLKGVSGADKAVQKGAAYFFTRCADEFYKAGDVTKAREHVNNALAADTHYWETEYLRMRLLSPEVFKPMSAICEVFHMSGANPYHCLRAIRKIKELYDEGEYEEEFKKIIEEYHWQNYMSLEDLGAMLPVLDMGALLNILTRDGITDSIAFDNDIKRIEAKIVIMIGELLHQKGHSAWIVFFQKAVELLQYEERSDEETYWLASTYERLEHTKKAEQLFLSLIENQNINIAGGALFHLGSMMLTIGRNEVAYDYFTRCLNILPGHGKAGEMLRELEMKLDMGKRTAIPI